MLYTEAQKENAVRTERERIKRIIHAHEAELIDEAGIILTEPETTPEGSKRVYKGTLLMVDVFTQIEEQIDQHNLSTMTIGETEETK